MGLARSTGGHAMKAQAHSPAVTISARGEWRTAIGAGSFLGALLLILAVQSGVLFNDPLLDRWEASRNLDYHVHSQISSTHRVSLNVHSLVPATRVWSGLSVAHALPANVALSQRFSVGAEARAVFEVFGASALRKMLASEKTDRQLRPTHDRLMLMLMLLRLPSDRRG
jgi:hypothetical protein